MTLNDVSTWLDANQLMVFSIMVPFASFLAASLGSWVSVRRTLRSEKERRNHEAVVQISAFRQDWINELRRSLAEFHSIGVHPDTTPSQHEDFYRLGTQIELMLNPKDEDYEELQLIMYEYLAVDAGRIIEKYEINSRFIEVSQRILKREWERLKEELRYPNKFVGSA